MRYHSYIKAYKTSGGQIYLYDYAHDKAINIHPELFSILTSYDRHSDLSKLSRIHPSFYQALLTNELVVNSNESDFDICKDHLWSILCNPKVFTLTINPTLDCNLRCWYCYEQHTHNCFMSEDVTKAILRFSKQKIAEDELETFVLSFFGGEPLLRANELSIRIASKVADYCSSMNKRFRLHFTTNGTLLTPDIIDKLASICKDTSVQIPFDGGHDQHNAIKKSKTIKDTYALTLDHVKTALTKGLQVTIRCNFDQNNLTSFRGLIDDLSDMCPDHFDKLRFDFQKIWQTRVTQELSDNLEEIRDHLAKVSNKSTKRRTVTPNTFCYGDYHNSIVVNYDGSLHKCTAIDFSRATPIGHITPEGALSIMNNPYSFENRLRGVCRSCRLFPVCTVCIEAKINNPMDKCPIDISNEDIGRQIMNRFEALFDQKVDRELTPAFLQK